LHIDSIFCILALTQESNIGCAGGLKLTDFENEEVLRHNFSSTFHAMVADSGLQSQFVYNQKGDEQDIG
jgi:hypothetical protein